VLFTIFLENPRQLLSGSRPVVKEIDRLEQFVSSEVIDSVAEYAQSFQNGQPFRHVVIDQFLAPEFCARICEEFPAFESRHAVDENKKVGGKATREKVRLLGPAFEQADDLVQSVEFLKLVEQLTGIQQVHYDPFYFGGGTHENRAGQDLDPHVDFNYHPVSNQHRRLNLIIYLNDEWDDAWGGSLQLHRDPYLEPDEDEIVTVTPLMNRCVIFETTEHSWHGFERIKLPEDKQHLSRKSFAVYFYTDVRPSAETGVEHSTIYVERHLPARFKTGTALTEEDVGEIKRLLARRDQHLKRLYQNIKDLNEALAETRYSGSGNSSVALDLDEVPEDLRSAVRMIQDLRRKVHDFETSTSWRLTAPVRAVKRLLTGKS